MPKGTPLLVINRPPGEDSGSSEKGRPAGTLLFARNSEALNSIVGAAVESAGEDRLTWIVYPGGGKLDTDMNRDRLWALMKPFDIRAVR